MVPLSNLITTLVVVRNGVPKMKGLFSSSLMSKITKSTGYTCSATSTNMSSAIPKGYIYEWLARDSLMSASAGLSLASFTGIPVSVPAGEGLSRLLRHKLEERVLSSVWASVAIPLDIVAEFYSPSRWKELSKETSSKILPCGDGSCWKTFKPV
ncbi:hypothetical protein Tco_1026393, partial [Tanacetum coccineum]